MAGNLQVKKFTEGGSTSSEGKCT